ncbi:hypothetical protein MPH_12982, partial [Macrophomina phaseolina MS6]
ITTIEKRITAIRKNNVKNRF